jgi:hypothetical protein
MFNKDQLEIIKKALELHAGSIYSKMEYTTDKDHKNALNAKIEAIDDIIKLIEG